jgi:LmbE family N-acetylglucosaminyl deacetylase
MRTIVIAPHPDDETLGVGGTLLRRKNEGSQVAWVVVTNISVEAGWSSEEVQKREEELQQIAEMYRFDEVYSLNFLSTQLDAIPLSEIIGALSDVFTSFAPKEVFLPHSSDIHSDHRVVFNAVAAGTKWFRHPSIRRVLAYETLSETDFGLNASLGFKPNVFVDITDFIDKKIQAANVYASELGKFPFPRSPEAIRALASVRGATSGFQAAEAFELLRERY